MKLMLPPFEPYTNREEPADPVKLTVVAKNSGYRIKSDSSDGHEKVQ